jgi:hypothetical protein
MTKKGTEPLKSVANALLKIALCSHKESHSLRAAHDLVDIERIKLQKERIVERGEKLKLLYPPKSSFRGKG